MITKIKKNLTIDLKEIIAKEYLDTKKGNLTTLKEGIIKIINIVAIMWFIMICLFDWGIITPPEVNGYDTSENLAFLAHFPEKKTIIGCYNDITKETRQSDVCLKRGDHNIKLPPKEQIRVWLKYYNEFEIINRLAIVNFESDFTETAENKFAKGYVQTLKSHGVAPDINSQLTWMSKREKTYKKEYYNGKYGKVRGCGYYWNHNNYKDGFNAGEYGVMSCLYRYHYHAIKGTWYAKRGITTTKFYKYYMFGIK